MMQTETPQTGEQLLRLPAVEALTGLKKSSLYRMMSDPTFGFPSPVKLGRRMVAWRRSEVQNWIAGRVQASVLK